MQLKKNSRESQFGDTRAQFEEEYEMDDAEETADPRSEAPARQTRVRGESEGEAAARPARAESIVDVHSAFDGKYETAQDLRVQGTISGEVICRGLLTIEEEATARASIQARDAHIRGRLEGDIVCSGKLLLASTAVVTGTLKAGSLVVEEGASLSGTVETVATGAATPAAPTPAPTRSEEPAASSERTSVASSRGPAWNGERRQTPAAAPATDATTPTRNGRQAPSFAFVPTSEERAAAAERN